MDSKNNLLEDFLNFQKNLESNTNRHNFSDRFSAIILEYNFSIISDDSLLEQEMESKLFKSLLYSPIIIISQDDDLNRNTQDKYLIIAYEKTIIILKQSKISFLHAILYYNTDKLACFLGEAEKNIIDLVSLDKIKNRLIKTDDLFLYEIEKFTSKINIKKKQFYRIWKIIAPCITGYLIKKGYLQTNLDRFRIFYTSNDISQQTENIDENEYVELRNLGSGCNSVVFLAYFLT